MTRAYKCPSAATGYRGQRYEVRALRPPHDTQGGAATQAFVVGWTEEPDGGGLVRMVSRHPSWHSARVIDLGEDEWKREPTRDDMHVIMPKGKI